MTKTVAVLGPQLTYTDAAAKKYYRKQRIRRVYPSSIDAVIAAVESGEADEGVVPEENRVKHEIEETYARIYGGNVTTVGKVIIPIQNCVGTYGSVPLDGITEVWTKADAYAQCGDWLGRHMPNARLVARNSTAGAIEELSREKLTYVAAIGPHLAIAHYGLHSAAQGIDDRKDNATLFAVIRKGRVAWIPEAEEHIPSGDCETWLMMMPSGDAAGELYRLLTPISRHGVDMTKIVSITQDRLMRDGKELLHLPGGYLFQVNVRG
ncbi:MAG: prephenate dehydratase domain-containing protein, partial [Nanoarchaeota archaeon]